MSFAQVTLFALFAASFASFVWAMSGGFFRTAGDVPRGTRLIQVIGGACMLAHAAVLASPGAVRGIAALAAVGLYSASLGLFWSAIWVNWKRPLTLAFSADSPVHLVTEGPYRHVRHPFYVSYTVAWIGGVVATRSVMLVVTVLAMGLIYYRAATAEEAKFEGSILAKEFAEYRRVTGMFVPTWLATFSRGRAPQRLMRCLTLYAAANRRPSFSDRDVRGGGDL